jgi:hypothetical protein
MPAPPEPALDEVPVLVGVVAVLVEVVVLLLVVVGVVVVELVLLVLVVVVGVLELLVLVVVVGALCCRHCFAASWLTVEAPWARLARNVGLIDGGRPATAFAKPVTALAAAPQFPASTAEEIWLS